MSSMQTLDQPYGVPVQKEGKGFFVGVDFGKDRDFTALVILERVWQNIESVPYLHLIRHVHRYPLGIEYKTIARDIMERYFESRYLHISDQEHRPVGGHIQTSPL